MTGRSGPMGRAQTTRRKKKLRGRIREAHELDSALLELAFMLLVLLAERWEETDAPRTGMGQNGVDK